MPDATIWAYAPGAWNAVRVWIRRRVRFSTYHVYVAPLIGWPRTQRSGR